MLDGDAEVYRLGYGTLEATELVTAAARQRDVAIRRQSGVRIGVIIADHQTLVFTPNPALLEAGPNTSGAANAIRLTTPPPSIESDLGLGDEPPSVGTTAADDAHLDAVKEALAANPPRRFDLARMERVFTIRSQLEFELRAAFGSAAGLAGQMVVTCRFKGVTYELLTDAVFVKKARAAFPGLPELHDEHVAAPAADSER